MADRISTFSGQTRQELSRLLRDSRDPNRSPLPRRKYPIGGGGGGGCDPQNTIWQLTILGKPTGGTIAFQVVVNGVSTGITFNWNDSAATFKSTLAAGHSEIASTDLTVTGGGFPNSTMNVEFIGTLANTDIQLPYATWGSLTGGTGVGVIASLAQKGHA